MIRWAIGIVFLAFAIILLGSSTVMAGQKDKRGNKPPPPPVVVNRWDWTVFDERDKVIEKGTFTVHGYELRHNNKRIGTYDDVSETEVKVDVSDGRLKGKLTLTKEKGSKVNWEGTLDSDKKGQSYKVTVSFVKPIVNPRR